MKRSRFVRPIPAVAAAAFIAAVVPIVITLAETPAWAQKKGDALKITKDEEPGRGNVDKLPSLRAAFHPQPGLAWQQGRADCRLGVDRLAPGCGTGRFADEP